MDGVFTHIISPSLNAFASLAFEDICKEFICELQKRNKLPFRYAKIGRWFGKTTIRDRKAEDGITISETEIVILAISKISTEYLVGECKFKDSVFSYSEYLDTIAKLTPQKSNAKFYYALFSKSGFDSRICDENIFLFNLSDIFNI